MSWAAIGSAAVSVVGGVVQGEMAKKGGAKAVYTEPTDPIAIAKNTIEGNTRLLPSAGNLSRDISMQESDLMSDLMEKQIPGFSRMQGKLTDRADAMLSDPYSLPPEVAANIERLAAERGVSVGGRGQFGDFSVLRDLGRNSLDFGSQQIQQAQSIWSLVNSVAPKVNPVSPLAFLPTTGQAIEADVRNKSNTQATAQGAANNAAAARSASMEGYGQAFGAFSQFLGDYLNRPKTTTPTTGTPASESGAGRYGKP